MAKCPATSDNPINPSQTLQTEPTRCNREPTEEVIMGEMCLSWSMYSALPGALPGSGVFGQMLCLHKYLTPSQIENSLSKDKRGEYFVHIYRYIDSINGVLLPSL